MDSLEGDENGCWRKSRFLYDLGRLVYVFFLFLFDQKGGLGSWTHKESRGKILPLLYSNAHSVSWPEG